MLPSDLATIDRMIDQVQDAAFALKFSAGSGMSKDLARWENMACKAVLFGDPITKFDSKAIPPGLHGALSGALECTKTVRDVKLIFADLLKDHDA